MTNSKPVAYLSSFNVHPRSLQPIAKCNLSPNDQLSTVVFADQNSKRTVSVSATGEFSLPPDKVKLIVLIKSSKETVDEAKHSVYRRFEYVYQTLRKNRIKEEDISVSKIFARNEKLYEVTYEVGATLDDFKKYELLQNQFVEKLDTCVTVLEPKFFHSSLRLENIRRQATIQAIRNAKHTALDIAKSVSLALGKPLNISEDKIKECEGLISAPSLLLAGDKKTINELIEEKTVTASAVINVTFELKTNKRNQDS